MKKPTLWTFLYSISDDVLVYVAAVLGVMSIRVIPILVAVLNGAKKADLSGFTPLYFIAVAIAAVIAIVASYVQNQRGMNESDTTKLQANKEAKANRIVSRCVAAFVQGAGILGILSSFGGSN